MIYEANAAERAAYIQGLQDYVDWLKANPQAPTARSEMFQLSTHGTDAEARADVDRFALLVGAEAKTRPGGDFYEAALHFGPIKYYAVAIGHAWTEEDAEVRRLGNEALAAKRAAELPVIDAEIVEAPELDAACEHDPSPIAPSICRKGCGTYLSGGAPALPVAADDAPLMGGARR
jgi:hypothetical protein